MSNFSRRLRKLESQVFDDSGLVPHSPEWYDYWLKKIRKYTSGDRSVDLRGVTVELIRLYMQECPSTAHLDYEAEAL